MNESVPFGFQGKYPPPPIANSFSPIDKRDRLARFLSLDSLGLPNSYRTFYSRNLKMATP
jgi:hypothetical protein